MRERNPNTTRKLQFCNNIDSVFGGNDQTARDKSHIVLPTRVYWKTPPYYRVNEPTKVLCIHRARSADINKRSTQRAICIRVSVCVCQLLPVYFYRLNENTRQLQRVCVCVTHISQTVLVFLQPTKVYTHRVILMYTGPCSATMLSTRIQGVSSIFDEYIHIFYFYFIIT